MTQLDRWPKLTREDIVAEARRWLGTPYRHQGRVLGTACDCLGLISMTGSRLGCTAHDELDYGSFPNPTRMRESLSKHLVPIALGDLWIGDVALMGWSKRAHHLAILTPIGMIHAYADAYPPSVVEHPVDVVWRSRFKFAFSFPGVE